MIIIKETPKAEVLEAIDREIGVVQGLNDTITLINDSPVNREAVQTAINANAVLKGLDNDTRKFISPKANLLDSVEFAVQQLQTWLLLLRNRIAKSSVKEYDTETLTFKEKGILDSISSINFYTRYLTMVLDIALTQANKPERLEAYLEKADFRFFNDTAKYFSHLTTKFNGSVKELETMIDKLSDETYDTVSEDIIRGQLGFNSVSVQKNLAPHELNPFHWMKLRAMKSDVKLMKSSAEDIDMLVMKIARLNNRRNGAEDPSLDRQIEVYQNDIIKKRAKIAQIEDKYKYGN